MNRRIWDLIADKRVQRAALLVLLWLPAVVVLFVVREVLLPFLLAFALAYVITPPVRWLSAQKIPFLPGGRTLPRWVAVIALYVVAAFVVWVGGRIFVPQLYKELTRASKDAGALFEQLSDENIEAKARELSLWIEQNDLPIRLVTAEDEEEGVEYEDPRALRDGTINVDAVKLAKDFINKAKTRASDEAFKVAAELQGILGATIRFVLTTFLVLMLTAFIVADAERITTFLYTITPVRDRETMAELMSRIDRGLSGVVRGQLTICIINGVLTLVGLLLLKVKFAFLLATLAAIFSLIPVFGSILSTIPIVVVGLSSGLSTAVLSVLWIVGIHALEANFLNPKIMGDAAKIHPVLIILALVVGEHFYSLTGALFAVPLMSTLVTVWKAVRQRAMRLDDEIHRHEPSGPVERPRQMKKLRRSDGG